MTMWIDRLMASPTTRAVELTAAFAEQRQRVLAENLANISTPGYHAQQLDSRAFQKSLQEALQRSDGTDENRLELRGNAQVSTDAAGKIEVTPAVEPAANVLFHDGTNAKLERTIADINENSLVYELSTSFLRTRYQNLLSAIRGRMA